MANYKKLTDVEVMEEVSESTMALVEENGKLKKVPCGAGFGGGNGVATAIIKGNRYMKKLNSVPEGNSVATYIIEAETFTCSNMTFEEASEIILAGEPLTAIIMGVFNGEGCISTIPTIINRLKDGPLPTIVLTGSILHNAYQMEGEAVYSDYIQSYKLYWTHEGLSYNEPNAPV